MTVTNRLRTQGTTNLLAAADRLGARRMVTQSIVLGYGFHDHGDRIITELPPFGIPADDLTDDTVAAMAFAESADVQGAGRHRSALWPFVRR